MTRERQLAAGREDAHTVVGAGVGRREQEGGLAEVGPAREGLHTIVVERVGAVDDRERIAAQRRVGEDVDLAEGEARHGATGASRAAGFATRPPADSSCSSASAAASAATPRSIASAATVTNESRKVLRLRRAGEERRAGNEGDAARDRLHQ